MRVFSEGYIGLKSEFVHVFIFHRLEKPTEALSQFLPVCLILFTFHGKPHTQFTMELFYLFYILCVRLYGYLELLAYTPFWEKSTDYDETFSLFCTCMRRL